MTISPISDPLGPRKPPAGQAQPERLPHEPELPPSPGKPEIYPQKSPDVSPRRIGIEIGPGPQNPEIYPQRSPDASPPQPPIKQPETPSGRSGYAFHYVRSSKSR